MKIALVRRLISIATGVIAVFVLAALMSEKNGEGNALTTDSTQKGGTLAFLQLLRESGFNVRVDSNTVEFAEEGDLVILPYVASADVSSRVRRSAKRGSHLLLLPLSQDLADTTFAGLIKLETAEVTNLYSGEKLKVSMDLTLEGPFKVFERRAAQLDLFIDEKSEDGLVAVSIAKIDTSKVFAIADGSIAQNAKLNQVQNAELLVGLVGSLKPKRIVFSEALIAPSAQSLIRALGPGTESAWFQIWVLLFVGFSAMSIRFGLPPDGRVYQSGGKSAVFAIANALKTKGRVQELKDAVRSQFFDKQALRHRTSRQNLETKPEKFLSSAATSLLLEIRTTESPDRLANIAKKLSEE